MNGPMPPRPMMPQQQAAAPAPGAPPMPPAGAAPGGAATNNGPQPTQDIGFNQQVQNILWSRVQSLAPEEIDALDEIVTAETFPVLVKVFPEMKVLFEQASAMAGGGYEEEYDEEGGMPQEEERNPLATGNNMKVSRGLVG